jgi:hypothetical protein
LQDGYTALHYAAKRGHYKLVEILLEAGANLDMKDNKVRAYYLPSSNIYSFDLQERKYSTSFGGVQ